MGRPKNNFNIDEALSAYQRLLNAASPADTTVRAMREWFLNTSGAKEAKGKHSAQLWGASEGIYSDKLDLVALRVPSDHDRLSQFIQNNFGIFFKTQDMDSARDCVSGNGRQVLISHQRVSTFSTVLSLILASILLFGAVISLSIIKKKQILLGMLCFWTILFAICVGLLTNAKRDQVFGATAAYAAVLVVFISGDLGGGTDGRGCICTPAPG